MQLILRKVSIAAVSISLVAGCDSNSGENSSATSSGSTTAGAEGETSSSSTGSPGTTSSTETGETATTTGVGDAWPPAQCPEQGALRDRDCLEALHDSCRSHASEEECETIPSHFFDGTGQYVKCGWVAVIPLLRESGCEVGVPSFRCEAFSTPGSEIGFAAPACDPLERVVWSFDAGNAEFVSMASTPNLSGPLGPWRVFGEGEPDFPYVGCTEGTSPPAPAECDCLPAACEALGS